MSLANYNPDASLLTPNQSAQLHVFSGGGNAGGKKLKNDVTADDILNALGFAANNTDKRDEFVKAYTDPPDYAVFVKKIGECIESGNMVCTGPDKIDAIYKALCNGSAQFKNFVTNPVIAAGTGLIA